MPRDEILIGPPPHPAIRMDDDPILRTKSTEVTPEDLPEVVKLVDVMRQVAGDMNARGLAAIQLGIPLRVLIARDGAQYRAFINPTLDRTLNRTTVEREGCLSVPGSKWGDVERPAKCDASWTDEEGERHSATLTADLARIFQHEFDHLNGVLMTDRRREQGRIPRRPAIVLLP